MDFITVKGGNMGRTSSAAKNRWLAAHYTQIKIAVDPELAESFKALCSMANTTVTGELSAFMAERCGKASALKRPAKDLLATRGGRRKGFNEAFQKLEDIKDAEAEYMSNIPANLRGSVVYEAAEQCVSVLEEGLDVLSGAFG
jgi:hypothetical protein